MRNPFTETAKQNAKEARLWSIARLVAGIILILTIILM
jgi:hypothetical protein